MTNVGVPPRVRLVDAVYAQLRNAILGGVLEPGTALKAAPLAEELQVSRGPVRLALQRLTSEGLVVERPHTTAVVRDLSPQDVVDLQNTRIGLERIAFALATRARLDTTQLTDMISSHEKRLVGAAEADYAQHELEFHRFVASHCGNETLAQLFEGISGLIALAHSGVEPADRQRRLLEDHRQLVRAIEAGEDHAAAALAAKHVSSLRPADGDEAERLRHLLLAD